MEEKDKPLQPASIQDMISQGIQMKRRDTAPVGESTSVGEPSAVAPQPVVKERAKRRSGDKADYESSFLFRNDLKERKTIYVAREMQTKLTKIVEMMHSQELTVGMYVENIITHHFELYKDEINRLCQSRYENPL